MYALSEEKKHTDAQLEATYKRLSDITLHFKTAEALAREMTERAKVPLGWTPFLYQERAA